MCNWSEILKNPKMHVHTANKPNGDYLFVTSKFWSFGSSHGLKRLHISCLVFFPYYFLVNVEGTLNLTLMPSNTLGGDDVWQV